MKTIAMIPARLGSQRLAKKNLREVGGVSLLAWAVRRARAAGCFDEIWVNSEALELGAIGEAEGARFHQRPSALADSRATSEEFVAEFLLAHPCDYLVQVHSIAPLTGAELIRRFTAELTAGDADAQVTTVREQIECFYNHLPVNFDLQQKTNSQQLEPVERVTWALTGWRCATYLAASTAGRCATWAGRVHTFPTPRWSGHIIKVEEDLEVAEALLKLM